ncbi:hypothetical protein BCV69DRAFT_295834 [Microstroma glucosiphilum]|uniref:Uncharacterized protein n=1 Tax=Pseudomicrostroma glucosiphilum TaxID=1684307 RepID=A0A316UF00_9BASI|nr:hypothetical protein BCV69DRAFT_295834 [Pseudomicrostroma glucosiphilum]PWN23508.1 hypothetical protein BCV69DRAFT_295834 [Pseudomicrostroma glucosiphilum]
MTVHEDLIGLFNTTVIQALGQSSAGINAHCASSIEVMYTSQKTKKKEPDASWKLVEGRGTVTVLEMVWGHEGRREVAQELTAYRGKDVNVVVMKILWRGKCGEAAVATLHRQEGEFERWAENASVSALLQPARSKKWEVTSYGPISDWLPLDPTGKEIEQSEGQVVALPTNWFVRPQAGDPEKFPLFLENFAMRIARCLQFGQGDPRAEEEVALEHQRQNIERSRRQLAFLQDQEQLARLGLTPLPEGTNIWQVLMSRGRIHLAEAGEEVAQE